MNGIALIEFKLRQQLTVVNWTSSRDELVIRCPYCGDSDNPNHAHLYISAEKPHSWYCQRCNTTGIFSINLMKDLEFYDSDLSIYLQKVSSSLKYDTLEKQLQKNLVERQTLGTVKVKIPIKFKRRVEAIKLKYFSERMGIENTPKNILGYKIITNFKDFFKANAPLLKNISLESSKNEKEKKYRSFLYNFLSDKCIGFLSTNNRYIHFRVVDELITGYKPTWRWKILPLFLESGFPNFYTIPSQLDLMEPYLNLIMAEGVFDIIGIKEYLDVNELKGLEEGQNLFCAATGKYYYKVIKTFLREGFLSLNIFIFSDKDVTTKFYEFLKEEKLFKELNLNVYYNTYKKEKDFGVHCNKITIEKVII